MLVVYSRWVRIFGAKTTRSYITSIVEGWENIANQMEIYQTPWFNFMTFISQQYVLLTLFESTRLKSLVNIRDPLRDIISSKQNSETLKRKPQIIEVYGNKKKNKY